MPAMEDPNFNATVTYLCKHDAEGALGVVINRPERHVARRACSRSLAIDPERSRARAQPVLRGGPVEPERGFVLHRSRTPSTPPWTPAARSRSRCRTDILAAVARGDGPEPYVVALGYAGWGRGQLEAELSRNAWLTVAARPGHRSSTRRSSSAGQRRVGLPGVDIHQITSYAGHA